MKNTSLDSKITILAQISKGEAGANDQLNAHRNKWSSYCIANTRSSVYAKVMTKINNIIQDQKSPAPNKQQGNVIDVLNNISSRDLFPENDLFGYIEKYFQEIKTAILNNNPALLGRDYVGSDAMRQAVNAMHTLLQGPNKINANVPSNAKSDKSDKVENLHIKSVVSPKSISTTANAKITAPIELSANPQPIWEFAKKNIMDKVTGLGTINDNDRHDYIQLALPNNEPSKYANKTAYFGNIEDVNAYKAKYQEQHLHHAKVMWNHWGIEYDNAQNIFKCQTGGGSEQRFKKYVMSPVYNHNQARITRCITSLFLIQGPELAQKFQQFLINHKFFNTLERDTQNAWRNAIDSASRWRIDVGVKPKP